MKKLIQATRVAVALQTLMVGNAWCADKIEKRIEVPADLVVANGQLLPDAKTRISDMVGEAKGNGLEFVVHYPKGAPAEAVYDILLTGAGIYMDEDIDLSEPKYVHVITKYKK